MLHFWMVDVAQDVVPAPAADPAQEAESIIAAPVEQAGVSFAYDDLKKRYALQFLSLALAWRAKGSTEQDMYCMPVQAGAVRQLRSLLSLSGPQAPAHEERPWWDDTGHGHPLATEGFKQGKSTHLLTNPFKRWC
jgi:hypothetical protein